ATLMRRNSLTSREMVACATSKPARRSSAASSSCVPTAFSRMMLKIARWRSSLADVTMGPPLILSQEQTVVNQRVEVAVVEADQPCRLGRPVDYHLIPRFQADSLLPVDSEHGIIPRQYADRHPLLGHREDGARPDGVRADGRDDQRFDSGMDDGTPCR